MPGGYHELVQPVTLAEIFAMDEFVFRLPRSRKLEHHNQYGHTYFWCDICTVEW
jgi:hypothetical protein